MLQHFNNADGLVHLHGYWARLELGLGTDLVAARGVWESLLRIWFDHIFFCHIIFVSFFSCFSVHFYQPAACFHSGSMLEAWQGYIAMEIELGHINEARSLYKRCYSKRFPGTGSEVSIFFFKETFA